MTAVGTYPLPVIAVINNSNRARPARAVIPCPGRRPSPSVRAQGCWPLAPSPHGLRVAAAQTRRAIKSGNGLTDYLQAIVNARQGNNDAAASFLRSAIQKDPSLKDYADKDLELAKIAK